MRYVWIIMLAMIDVVWIIASVCEVIRAAITIKNWNYDSLFDLLDLFLTEIDDYAHGCVWTHLFILFMYSLISFIQTSGVAG